MVIKTIILSIGMISIDYISDLVTGYQHFLAEDFAWVAWTYGVILLPGAINFFKDEYSMRQSQNWLWWLMVMPRLVFWSLFFQLNIVRDFYASLFEPNSLAISIDKAGHRRVAANKFVESVNKTSSQKNMEAFIEAGMQMCLQSYIIARRGQAPPIQLISLLISFLTLSKACSENHITTQSMLLSTSILQTLKTLPLFLAPCISKVLTIAIVLAFNAVSPMLGLLLPIILLVGNTSVMWWMLPSLGTLECFMSGLCCLLNTTIMIKESSPRIAQLHQLHAYATSQMLASMISIVWLVKLIFLHSPNRPDSSFEMDQVIIPAYQNIKEIIFILISMHILSAISFNVISVLYKPGKGIGQTKYKGEFPSKKFAKYEHSDCSQYLTNCVNSTDVSYSLPVLAVGSTNYCFPTGSTLRASLDVFKGDYFDQELTFCRFDKLLVLNWKEDGRHHRDIWQRGRIVSTFFDEGERNQRYGISVRGIHMEGYFPANVVFYDMIQMSPVLDWWWVQAGEQIPLLPCGGGAKDRCSRNQGTEEMAGVPYSCSNCPAADLCGWCWVSCHAGHKGGVNLAIQGSYAVPWAGRRFTCSCSCRGSYA